MVSATRARTRFRILFVPYALGLVFWLVLGILPTLAADVPAIHHQFLAWAEHNSFAERVLHPTFPGRMGPDRTTTAQALLQYAFSLLNFGLGLLLAVRRSSEQGAAAARVRPARHRGHVQHAQPSGVSHHRNAMADIAYPLHLPHRFGGRLSLGGDPLPERAVTAPVAGGPEPPPPVGDRGHRGRGHRELARQFSRPPAVLRRVLRHRRAAGRRRRPDPAALRSGHFGRRAPHRAPAHRSVATGADHRPGLGGRPDRRRPGLVGRGRVRRARANLVPGGVRARARRVVRRHRPVPPVGHRPSAQRPARLRRDRLRRRWFLRPRGHRGRLSRRRRDDRHGRGPDRGRRGDRAAANAGKTVGQSGDIRPGPLPDRGDPIVARRTGTVESDRGDRPADRGGLPGHPRQRRSVVAARRRAVDDRLGPPVRGAGPGPHALMAGQLPR